LVDGTFAGDILNTPSGWPTATIAKDESTKRIYLSFGILGDTNNDGVVDAADYITVKRHMGQGVGSAGASAGDFDLDGDVDWDDLQILIGAMGAGGNGGGTIPEPATLGLLALGALAVVRRRNRR